MDEVIYEAYYPEPPSWRQGILIRCLAWTAFLVLCGVAYRIAGG